MKLRKFACITLLLFASSIVYASVCSPGTLTDYLSLGSAGCTIGTTGFGNFETLSIPNAATQIDPNLVQVTPGGGPTTPTLLFTFNMSASAGEFFDLNFGFDVTDNFLVGANATMTGTSATDDGVVTVIEEFCPAGVFSPTCSSGPESAFTLIQIDGFASTTDSAAFAAVASLQVRKDIGIDGGLFGTSALGSLSDEFVLSAATTPVPEPGSIYLFTSAISAFALHRVRRRKS